MSNAAYSFGARGTLGGRRPMATRLLTGPEAWKHFGAMSPPKQEIDLLLKEAAACTSNSHPFASGVVRQLSESGRPVDECLEVLKYAEAMFPEEFEGFEKASSFLSGTFKGIRSGVASAGKGVQEAVQAAPKAFQEAGQSAVQSTRQIAGQARQAVQPAVQKTQQLGQRAAGYAKDTAIPAVKTQAQAAGIQGQRAAQNTRRTIRQAPGQAVNAVKNKPGTAAGVALGTGIVGKQTYDYESDRRNMMQGPQPVPEGMSPEDRAAFVDNEMYRVHGAGHDSETLTGYQNQMNEMYGQSPQAGPDPAQAVGAPEAAAPEGPDPAQAVGAPEAAPPESVDPQKPAMAPEEGAAVQEQLRTNASAVVEKIQSGDMSEQEMQGIVEQSLQAQAATSGLSPEEMQQQVSAGMEKVMADGKVTVDDLAPYAEGNPELQGLLGKAAEPAGPTGGIMDVLGEWFGDGQGGVDFGKVAATMIGLPLAFAGVSGVMGGGGFGSVLMSALGLGAGAYGLGMLDSVAGGIGGQGDGPAEMAGASNAGVAGPPPGQQPVQAAPEQAVPAASGQKPQEPAAPAAPAAHQDFRASVLQQPGFAAYDADGDGTLGDTEAKELITQYARGGNQITHEQLKSVLENAPPAVKTKMISQIREGLAEAPWGSGVLPGVQSLKRLVH